MKEISIEEARQQEWVAATSPRVDRDLIGKMSDERLAANLDAVYGAAVKQYGSQTALRRALKRGVVVEAYLKYEGERYVVHVGQHFIIDRPTVMVMHLDEAHAQGFTDTRWDSPYDEQSRS